MEFFPVIAGLVWLVPGAIAVAVDLKDFPRPVVHGVDEILRGVIFLAGPIGLFAVLLMRNPPELRR